MNIRFGANHLIAITPQLSLQGGMNFSNYRFLDTDLLKSDRQASKKSVGKGFLLFTSWEKPKMASIL